MLGRTANDLFWLSRYVERAENMARLIEAGCRIGLVSQNVGTDQHDWRSTLQSAACEPGFLAKYEAVTTRDVIDYLVFDTGNSSSIASCLATARRNARAQRTALTREMWESLNSSWIEFQAIKPSNVGSAALMDLLDWIKECSAAYRGALLNTILRNDTFSFSQLGTFLERADNTARILDVKYYVLLPRPEMAGGSVDNAQWGSLLRSVSAHRSYRWVYKESYRPWRIAEYLMLNKAMPRSLLASYIEIGYALAMLAEQYGRTQPSHALAQETLAMLEGAGIDQIFQSGLHEFLQDFISRNNKLGAGISASYHFEG
jgi:uncharacterized alpha-E superfamily protein